MILSIELDTRAFELEIERQKDLAIRRLGEALHAMAETTMIMAKADYVPVRTGFLRSSGWVESNYVVIGDQVTVNLGFSAEYAEQVHEGPGSRIGASPGRPLAGRKYLERAMLEISATAEERIARFMGGMGSSLAV